MNANRRLAKALEAASDALQHLSETPDFACLDYTHIDRLLARIADLPTESQMRNSRRNLLVIRQWMIVAGPGVVFLEVFGQLYWRLGELNAKQFESFKTALQKQRSYLDLIRNHSATTFVIQRLEHIQRSKLDAYRYFLYELSDFTSVQTDSPMADMDSIRTPSSYPLTTPSSVRASHSSSRQETGLVGLIKYVPDSSVWGGDIEQLLLNFYFDGICPGRTMATMSNTYLSLLQTANVCKSTKYALLSLSASYISEYLPSELDRCHQAELYYCTQAIQALARQINEGDNYDAALATAMLLMHHATINNADESNLCWSCHANIVDITPVGFTDQQSEPILFMRTHLVLARAAQTSFALQNTKLHSLETQDWYGKIPSRETNKICITLGLSPRLLFLISSINSLEVGNFPNKVINSQLYEVQVQGLNQWSSELLGDGQDIVLATAEAFRLATLIYLRCRIYGFTRFHASVTELNDALTAILFSLPTKRHLYTAIHPVWPFFIAAVTVNSDKRDRLYQHADSIRNGKNTLLAVLARVSDIQIWLGSQDAAEQRRDGWWDEMLQHSSSTSTLPANRLLCLG